MGKPRRRFVLGAGSSRGSQSCLRQSACPLQSAGTAQPSRWRDPGDDGRLLRHDRQKSEAIDNLQRALQLEPKNSDVLFRSALVYNHFGQTTQALQWLQKAIEAGYSRSEVRDFPDFDALQVESAVSGTPGE